MRGVKSESLMAIVDLLYYGEANVYQENLDNFLANAEELKLKGLMGNTEDIEDKTESNFTDQTPRQINPKPFCLRENEHIQSNLELKIDKQHPHDQMNIERRIVIPNFVTGDLMKK